MKKKTKVEDPISRLGILIDVMGITDDRTGMPPLSEENRAIVKLQLLAAQVLARDAMLLRNAKTVDEEVSADVLIDRLARTWTENIADFAKQMLSNNELNLNVVNVLKEFGKYTSLHN
jgi:hypothetical protein